MAASPPSAQMANHQKAVDLTECLQDDTRDLYKDTRDGRYNDAVPRIINLYATLYSLRSIIDALLGPDPSRWQGLPQASASGGSGEFKSGLLVGAVGGFFIALLLLQR